MRAAIGRRLGSRDGRRVTRRPASPRARAPPSGSQAGTAVLRGQSTTAPVVRWQSATTTLRRKSATAIVRGQCAATAIRARSVAVAERGKSAAALQSRSAPYFAVGSDASRMTATIRGSTGRARRLRPIRRPIRLCCRRRRRRNVHRRPRRRVPRASPFPIRMPGRVSEVSLRCRLRRRRLSGRSQTGSFMRRRVYPQEPDTGPMPAPHNDEFYDDAPRVSRRKGLLTVAAVLALAVIGTAGAFGYRTLFRQGSRRCAAGHPG